MREAVIEALGNIRDPRASQPLIAILSDPREDMSMRVKAAVAAGSIGDVSCTQGIADLYHGLDDWLDKSKLISALAEGKHIQLLLDIIVDSRSDIGLREDAAKKLKGLGWQHESNEIGATFCMFNRDWEACIAIGSPSVVPLVSWLSHDPTELLVKTLGEIGDSRAIDPLFAVLDREYRPLFNEESDGEIYSAGYAAMEEHKQKYDALRSAVLRALSKLRQNNKDEVESKAAARGITLS
jgi:HEAT repeat protein